MSEERPAPPPPPPTLPTLLRRIVPSVLAALVLYGAFVAYGDARKLGAALSTFDWRVVPVAVGLTAVNYAARMLRWHWYLRLVGARIGVRDSARVFLLGLPLVLTPAKVGEVLKSWVVRTISGAPVATTMPTILAERLVDGLAMIILSGVGLWGFPDHRVRYVALGTLAVMLAIVAVVQVRPLAEWVLERAERLPVVGPKAHQLHGFYESSYTLLRPRNLLPSVAIGIGSWLCEGLAFYAILRGLGAAPGMETVLEAIFIFSISTVVGALVATPAGLGGVEGMLVVLTPRLVGVSAATATAAALLVRFATLWFGVLLGVGSLVVWRRLLQPPEDGR
ncbi:MAG: flippase-like domain-containing protein [Ardenticatenales bacterium]|nr:flippase-like domain-containing protein [Ardenticatenales bacterium]